MQSQMQLQMKIIFLFSCLLLHISYAFSQQQYFNDESKTDLSFTQTLDKFNSLKPSDNWKEFFADSVYYVAVGDRQVWVKPSELVKLISYRKDEQEMLNFFHHHFRFGFRKVTNETFDYEDGVFKTMLENQYSFCTYPLTNKMDIEEGKCNCFVLTNARLREKPDTTSKIISTINNGCYYIDIPEFEGSEANPFKGWYKMDLNESAGYIYSELLVPYIDYLTRIYWIKQNGKWKISIIYLPAGC